MLSAKGVSVPRPAYNGVAEEKTEDGEEEAEAEGKKNIDATSDEDEDEE